MFVKMDKLDYSNIMLYNYRVYLYKKGGYPMKQIKKPLSILLSLILAFSVFSIFSFEVGAETASIQYIDRSWDEETKTVTETVKTLENPPVFEQDHYTGNVTVGNGWLFVDRNITIDQTMYIDNGYNVKLIIANGCTLTVKGGIYVRESAAFSVYGQQGDTGKLYATNEYDENEVAPIDGDTGSARFNVYGATIEAISDNRVTAGIGRNTSSAYSDNNFTITIWGGKVTAEGGRFRAGISGRITIYGGTVNATGGTYGGAGIGGGSERGGGNITINGGEVTAIGGTEGAGIGGGNYGNSGNITINSGKVNAYGGCVGAGIGGGYYGGGVNITINGGEIIAQSTDINTEGIAVGEGAGIGGGYHGNGGNITINGGTVEALSYADGAGIGGGDGAGIGGGNGGNITIRSGKITAISVEGGAGIGGGDSGSGGTINIYGGEINARCNGKDFGDGAGIGGGDGGDGGTVHIYGGKITAYADGESEGSAIGAGKGGSDGMLTIDNGLWVHTGVKPDSTDWRYRQNRVSECRSSKYAYIEPCTRHTADPEPDDGYPVWSDYESDNETTHSKHCVACNVTKDTHNHVFDAPVWTWGEEYATAKATFTCSDCGYSETVDATVTKDDERQTATATAVFRDTPYTKEQSTATPVYPYVRRSWNAETKQVEQTTETVYDYTILTTDTQNTFWAGNGWYVVTDDVTLKNFVTLGDNVNLLLRDGAKLTCNEGLICDTNQDGVVYGINIFAQENGTGELIANGKTDYAGIGGCDETGGGVITIHGGKITANGGADGAGIGGGNHGNAGTITIYGGMIAATGGGAFMNGGGAGIGGGNDGNGGTITIYGGNITANGGVSSTGGAGAGIGGGDGARSGNITINGGTITATGNGESHSGAGIGGGDYGDIDTITINGGLIAKAYSEWSAGIGSGMPKDTKDGMSGTITINGGTVNASSEVGAGIGAAYKGRMYGTINITGGTVNVRSKEGAGIGSGGTTGYDPADCSGTISITGGSVHAISDEGAGIGGGSHAECNGTISITGGTVEAEALDDVSSLTIPPQAIGAGEDRSVRGTIIIGDGLMVRSGDNRASAVWRFRENRVIATKDQYTLVSSCTRHIDQPQDGDPIWSNYEIVDETNHTQHCVACNAAKELLNHDFSDPVWTWGENYSTATAKFTCPSCTFETTLDATVTKEETQDGMVKATATVECLGTTYTDEQNTGMQALRYIKRSWNEETKQVEETTETLLNYYVLSSTNDKVWAANNRCEIGDTAHENTNGWYVVNDNVTLKRFVSQGMNVNLLLCDGATLTYNEGLICDTNQDGIVHSVNIFAQQNGTGELVANGSDDDDSAGIGGWEDKHGGVITIHGGIINATGVNNAAGIGGGDEGNGGTVTIYGGTVNATSNDDGAGIGGGYGGNGGTVTIYGGNITATGENNGAGIGGGYHGNGGTVNIYGGTVNAKSKNDGAGIGGGDGRNGGTVHIYGGTVTATGEESPAIGGYDDEAVGTLTIADGWMVRSGDNADSTDWRWRGERVSSCQSHHYAKIYPCDVHENETCDGNEVWDKTFKSDNDETHSYTCLACNSDANIQNHNIAASWTWKPDCSEASAHLSCADCGFTKDVTASGDQITDEIIDLSTNEHKFTATVTLAGNEYTSERTGCEVEYIGLSGETQLVYAIPITSATKEMTDGWYAVTEDVTINLLNGDWTTHNSLPVRGTVNLILCDNTVFNAKRGIFVSKGNSLTIWGQSKNAGVLNAKGDTNVNTQNAGIGGKRHPDVFHGRADAGSITINGGTINAVGDDFCAGIGGGDCGDATVTINGGIVTATGGGQAAGIGGGCGESLDNQGKGIVTINGGTVTAKGGWHSAGIGGSEYSDGIVNITGGKIVSESGGYAAAIGGGYVAKGEVTITGGDITANSGGIGSGWEKDGVESKRGSVTLDYGENGVSVYSSEYHNTDITLSKAFTDGTNIYQAGAVTEDQVKNKTLTPYDGMGVRLAAYSVSLEGDIAVNFHMEITPEVLSHDGVYMQFSVPNTSAEYQTQKVYLSEAKEKNGSYLFKCRVAAKNMESVISAQWIDGENKSVIYKYSVKEYADYLIAHADDQHPEYQAVKPLVEAMLKYGTYANNYFSNADALAALSVDIPEKTYTETNLPEGVTFDGATLSLKSQTTLSLYFVSTKDVTLSIDGKTEGVDYKLDHKGNEYVIRICNIPVAALNDNFTVTVTSGEESGTVTYSPLTYCYRAQTSGDAKLVNTVKALYLYWVEAAKYFV